MPLKHKLLGSNRTIVGLKLFRFGASFGFVGVQQSHHCGIETTIKGRGLVWARGSNRTIVGLKLSLYSRKNSFKTCSNRTIVGLKHHSMSSTKLLLSQQSHHCGIETAQKLHARRIGIRSNRTIVGLKLDSFYQASTYAFGSNRTIVGLKPETQVV